MDEKRTLQLVNQEKGSTRIKRRGGGRGWPVERGQIVLSVRLTSYQHPSRSIISGMRILRIIGLDRSVPNLVIRKSSGGDGQGQVLYDRDGFCFCFYIWYSCLSFEDSAVPMVRDIDNGLSTEEKFGIWFSWYGTEVLELGSRD